jgi:hypothetical protein
MSEGKLKCILVRYILKHTRTLKKICLIQAINRLLHIAYTEQSSTSSPAKAYMCLIPQNLVKNQSIDVPSTPAQRPEKALPFSYRWRNSGWPLHKKVLYLRLSLYFDGHWWP